MANEFIKNVVISRRWEDLNTAQGVYDFTALNADIDEVINSGRTFSLKITTGIYSPNYLVNLGVPHVTFQEFEVDDVNLITFNVPAVWNTTYKTEFKAFLTALRANLTSYIPNMTYISACGISRSSAELRLPAQILKVQNNQTSTDAKTIWLANGYSVDNVVDTFKEFATHTRGLFPNMPIVIPIVHIRTFPIIDTRNAYYEIMDWCATDNSDIYYIQDTYVNELYTNDAARNYALSKNLRICGQIQLFKFRNTNHLNNDFRNTLIRFEAAGGSFLEIHPSNLASYQNELLSIYPLYQ